MWEILFPGGLLILALITQTVQIPLSHILSVFGTAFFFQALAIFFYAQPRSSFLTAFSVSAGILLLCSSQSASMLALAAGLAISSQFLFQYREKPLFNPINFGIGIVLLYQRPIFLSEAQGSLSMLIPFWIGAFLMSRESLAFAVSYFSLLALSAYLNGHPTLVIQGIQSVYLLVFATSVVAERKQGALSIAVAIVGYIMQVHFNLSSGLFFAFLILSPIAVILEGRRKGRVPLKTAAAQ